MGQPTNRALFKAWCLRRLGKGAVTPRITDNQAEDRIDEAIAYWRDFHHTATELKYVAHQLTNQDIANKYITIPAEILEVTRMMPLGGSLGAGGSDAFNNLQYQYMATEVWNLANGGASAPMTNFYLAMRHIETVQQLFRTVATFRFNRYDNKLNIDTNWGALEAGSFVMYEGYATLDPALVSELWSDWWLQRYTCSLLKEQWGQNLSAFGGVTFLNGVTMNGEAIFAQGHGEREALEQEIKGYSMPPLPRIA